jgi:deoxyadenosine/deoxycytidine kinase
MSDIINHLFECLESVLVPDQSYTAEEWDIFNLYCKNPELPNILTTKDMKKNRNPPIISSDKENFIDDNHEISIILSGKAHEKFYSIFSSETNENNSNETNSDEETDYEGEIRMVSICGNISAGKSVLLDEIRRLKSVDFPELYLVPEPVNKWGLFKNSDNVSILEEFYNNQEKMAFVFQIYALQTRFETIEIEKEKALEKSRLLRKPVIMIFERTILDDYHIFAKMLKNSGKMTEFELMVYKKWYDYYVGKFQISKTVYLKTDPKICLDRVLIRKREGEDGIPLEYLISCHDQHEEFYNGVLISLDCLVVNNNHEKNSDSYSESIAEIINHFIKI